MDFGDVKMPKSVRLVPEIETLREQPWLSNEAVVMADVYHPDIDENLEYAPRHILKQTLKQLQSVSKIDSQILFTFILHKFGKDDKEQHHASNKGLLTLEQG
jgi:glutamine synthetase